jgi:putative FmdB family regulatory protein
MPTYEYECRACGHTFELLQPITAKPIRTCPECGKPRARRLIGTGVGIIFKGSGFYQTDYRSESYKKAAKAEAESASGGKTDKTDKSGDSASSSGSQPTSPSGPPGGRSKDKTSENK